MKRYKNMEKEVLLYQQTKNEEIFNKIYKNYKSFMLYVLRNKNSLMTIDTADIEYAYDISIFLCCERYDPSYSVKFNTFLYISCLRRCEMISKKRDKIINNETQILNMKDSEMDSEDNIDFFKFKEDFIIENYFESDKADFLINLIVNNVVVKRNVKRKYKTILKLLFIGFRENEVATILNVSRQNINQNLKTLRQKKEKIKKLLQNY